MKGPFTALDAVMGAFTALDVAAAANGAFFGHGADTDGLHELGLFMLGVAALFLAASVLDRSLGSLTD